MKRILLNHQIKVPEVRLISESGENLGIVKTNEALKKALEADLDLIEISPNAKPPVCKIVDYKKYEYQEKQKEKESSKKIHKTDTKEFRFGPYIGANDLNNKIERARKFLANKNRIKLTIVFKGREKAHPEIGREKAETFIKELENITKIEGNLGYKNGIISVMLFPI